MQSRTQFLDYIKTLAGETVCVTVGKRRFKAHQGQRGWYWKVAIPVISAYLGYDFHERYQLHEYCLWQFNGTPEIGSDAYDNMLRTSQMDTEQMAEYMDWIMRWAMTEHSVYIPEPNEVEDVVLAVSKTIEEA